MHKYPLEFDGFSTWTQKNAERSNSEFSNMNHDVSSIDVSDTVIHTAGVICVDGRYQAASHN